jgi:hypothetical protein
MSFTFSRWALSLGVLALCATLAAADPPRRAERWRVEQPTLAVTPVPVPPICWHAPVNPYAESGLPHSGGSQCRHMPPRLEYCWLAPGSTLNVYDVLDDVLLAFAAAPQASPAHNPAALPWCLHGALVRLPVAWFADTAPASAYVRGTDPRRPLLTRQAPESPAKAAPATRKPAPGRY